MGRQKLRVSLSFQQPMNASAPAMFSIAKRRACWGSESPCVSTIERNVRFQSGTTFSV